MDDREKELKALRAKKNLKIKKLKSTMRRHWNKIHDVLVFEDGSMISREFLEDNNLTDHIPREQRFKKTLD